MEKELEALENWASAADLATSAGRGRLDSKRLAVAAVEIIKKTRHGAIKIGAQCFNDSRDLPRATASGGASESADR